MSPQTSSVSPSTAATKSFCLSRTVGGPVGLVGAGAWDWVCTVGAPPSLSSASISSGCLPSRRLMTTTTMTAPPPRRIPPKPPPPPPEFSSTLSLRRKSSQRMLTPASHVERDCTALHRLHRGVYPSSSIERGQLDLSNLDRARSARMVPPVWQRAQ